MGLAKFCRSARTRGGVGGGTFDITEFIWYYYTITEGKQAGQESPRRHAEPGMPSLSQSVSNFI